MIVFVQFVGNVVVYQCVGYVFGICEVVVQVVVGNYWQYLFVSYGIGSQVFEYLVIGYFVYGCVDQWEQVVDEEGFGIVFVDGKVLL